MQTPHMYGTIVTEAPEGFVPYHQWPEYKLETDVPTFLGPRKVGVDPVGMYRRFWPIVVEEYISDKEPVLVDSDPKKISANRVLMWQRLFRTDTPAGWKRLAIKPRELEGFALLESAYYVAQWSESARRYRKKWREHFLNKECVVEKISAEDFKAAYVASDIKPYIRRLYTDMVTRKLAAGAPMQFFAARDIRTKTIISAMAVINSPTCHGSFYLCGFISKKYEHVPAMVGLMDAWHAESLASGIRFLHFGRFWQKGDPEDWKGFSTFKAKFGLHYISYPPALWRFVRGKLF
ncbi:MAG: hypothetical protein NT019_02705 [Candidatus Adlerbacteria bacterium]|nr:hypothetical protein [Candidatus Adlerbacteria bacterium]